MKLFIKNILIFGLLFILSAFLVAGAGIYLMQRTSFTIPIHKNILIIGDSSTECAINDSIFSRSYNISQSGSAYLYSYIKLKKFLEANEQIDTVLLAYHQECLVKSTDELWIYDNGAVSARMPAYFPFMNFDEYKIFLQKPIFYSSVFKIIVKQGDIILPGTIKGKMYYASDIGLGGYKYLYRNKLNKDIASSNFNSNADEVRTGESQLQIMYLQKINDYCRSKNVALILVHTPFYKSTEYFDVKQFYKTYNKHFSHIPLLDYSDFAVPDSCRGDVMHLNYKGAAIFSRYLQEKGIDYNKFYGTEMAKNR